MRTIYQRGSGCWVRVQKATGGYFRAATNDERIYWLIEEELDYRATSDEAQSDLDSFATCHGLVVVEGK